MRFCGCLCVCSECRTIKSGIVGRGSLTTTERTYSGVAQRSPCCRSLCFATHSPTLSSSCVHFNSAQCTKSLSMCGDFCIILAGQSGDILYSPSSPDDLFGQHRKTRYMRIYQIQPGTALRTSNATVKNKQRHVWPTKKLLNRCLYLHTSPASLPGALPHQHIDVYY